MIEPGSDVDRAWSKSAFAQLPHKAAVALRDTAVERRIEKGTVAYREPLPRSPNPMLALVVSGLFRLYVASPEGRQVTIRYDREGAILGLSSVMVGGSPGRLEAICDSRIVSFDVEVMRYLMKTDAAVASLVAGNLARVLFMIQNMLVDNVFGSVRTRVASHLIDLALPDAHGALVVTVGQQEIADAIGSVREVVSRVLGALRDEGVIRRDRHGLTLVDVPALHVIAHRSLFQSPMVA